MKNKIENYDIIDIFKKLWNFKLTIIKYTSLVSILSIIYSLVVNEKYTSRTLFIPSIYENDKSSTISNLASIAGIDLSSNSNSNIPSSLYPEIVKSIPFKVELLNYNLEKTNNNFLNYLNKNYNFNIKNDTISIDVDNYKNKIVNKNFYNLFKFLDKSIYTYVDPKIGKVELSVTLNNPIVTAEITRQAREILQRKIIDFKIKHKIEILNSTRKNYLIQKDDFELKQNRLANFRERNKLISSEILNSQLRILQNEYDISTTVFTELSKMLEKAKLDVTKNTPIFTTIQPAIVPIEKSYPNRKLIVISWTLFSFILISIFILIKDFFYKTLKYISN